MRRHTAGSRAHTQVPGGDMTLAELGGPRGRVPGIARPARRHLRRLARAVTAAGLTALCAMLLPAAASAIPPTGISGTVTSASTHVGIQGAEVCASPTGGGTLVCKETGSGGEYTIEGLSEGEYTVEFTGCVSHSCNTYAAQSKPSVKVKSGTITEHVNAELVETVGKISGRVTSGGSPVAGIEACAYGCRETNSNGEYTIEDVPAGSYKVSFSPKEECKIICQPSANYITQWWNGESTGEAANSVTVEAGKTTLGINAEMQAGGRISGKVTTASIYPQPIANVEVCANATKTTKEGEREYEERCALTTGSGEYTISALASGGFEVDFTGLVCTEVSGKVKCTHPYVSEIYQGVVSVSAPGTTSGIDGGLLEVSPTKPANTGAPALTGTAAVGKVLTCSTGSWANNPISLAYKWLRNGVALAGQIANTYTVQGADAGKGIACEVTASNGAGATGSTSNTVAMPAPIAVFSSVKIKGAVASVTLSCPGAAPCSGVMTIVARVVTGHGKHKRARNVTIGVASFSLGAGTRATFRVHLTGQGRKLLGKAGRKGLEVQIAGSGVQAHAVVLKGHR
jgi:hypothetical protein